MMVTDYKSGAPFFPLIETGFDVLGEEANFSIAKLTNVSDGTPVVNANDGVFTEIMEDDNGHTGTTVGAAVIGDATITLTAGDTLEIGDVFNDGAGNLYYIVSKVGDVIGIKGKLVADIADASAIAFAGNTGVYKVNMQIDAEMPLSVIFKHTTMGRVPARYAIVATTLDEEAALAETRYDLVKEKLDAMSGGSTFKVVG